MPALLDEHGVSPVSAAHLIVAWSHPGRCRSEAAFAALAGVSPLEASSGRVTRHQLNRFGDRNLNRKVRPRDPPLPEALHRPPPLPSHAAHRNN